MEPRLSIVSRSSPPWSSFNNDRSLRIRFSVAGCSLLGYVATLPHGYVAVTEAFAVDLEKLRHHGGRMIPGDSGRLPDAWPIRRGLGDRGRPPLGASAESTQRPASRARESRRSRHRHRLPCESDRKSARDCTPGLRRDVQTELLPREYPACCDSEGRWFSLSDAAPLTAWPRARSNGQTARTPRLRTSASSRLHMPGASSQASPVNRARPRDVGGYDA